MYLAELLAIDVGDFRPKQRTSLSCLTALCCSSLTDAHNVGRRLIVETRYLPCLNFNANLDIHLSIIHKGLWPQIQSLSLPLPVSPLTS